MKQIAAAFVKAQAGFAPALKQSVNPHFKSRYVDLAGCVEAVIDSLNANGIALIQRTSESETGAVVETIFLHESGEVLECGRLHVPASKHDAHGFCSALTYARRYSLMAACGIAPEDDDGNHATKTAPKVSTSVPAEVFSTLEPEEQKYLHSIADELLLLKTTEEQVAFLKTTTLDNDEKIGLWSLLPSGVRSAIKKAQKTPTSIELAGQA